MLCSLVRPQPEWWVTASMQRQQQMHGSCSAASPDVFCSSCSHPLASHDMASDAAVATAACLLHVLPVPDAEAYVTSSIPPQSGRANSPAGITTEHGSRAAASDCPGSPVEWWRQSSTSESTRVVGRVSCLHEGTFVHPHVHGVPGDV